MSRLTLALLWCAALAVAAGLLVVADRPTRDPDSTLYARLSGDLADRPASRWIAPEWGGAWDQHGLFREHPVGILMPSVLAIRAGFPREQAPYAVNMLYQAAAILLIPLVAGAVVPRVEAQALATALQLLPIAFVYRIRGNQEQPLLLCFLAMIYGAHKARSRPWIWAPLMIAALCFLVLVKGAFAMFAIVATALWLLLVPAPPGARDRYGWIGLAFAIACAVAMAVGYEALYVRTTGESFVEFYRSTRLGESMSLSDPGMVAHAARNVVWYVLRLLWFAAPWSIVAFIAMATWLPRSRRRPDRDARAVVWAGLVAAVFIAVLSPANVRAERFIFPVYYLVGAVGVVAAIRTNATMLRVAERTAPLEWLPIATWLLLFLVTLGSRALK